VRRPLYLVLTLFASLLLSQEPSEDLPKWTQYGRGGAGQLNNWGGLAFYRMKRIKGNSFHDLRLLGVYIPDNTLATARYKSSRKFDIFPRFYRFTVTSLRKSSASDLRIRYHYNQGFGAFLFDQSSTNLTSELALSYDMSDYLNDTRKTSYLKGGLFWDLDISLTSFAIDFEYFYQISDVVPEETALSRYEISAEMNVWIRDPWLVIAGYEEEFYMAEERRNVRYVYLSVGFKKPLPFLF